MGFKKPAVPMAPAAKAKPMSMKKAAPAKPQMNPMQAPGKMPMMRKGGKVKGC